MNIYSLIIIILFSAACIRAQTDSIRMSIEADTILISKSRLQESGGSHHAVHLDKKMLEKYSSRSLSDVLTLESTMFVKNYGPGGISSLSGRGGGASHTAVLWEGFNLQSPMLGQADISLLPAIFVDYIDIQYGGESALFGNSSVGGAIHMGTKTEFGKGWQFRGNFYGGSFENFGQQMHLNYSSKGYAFSMRSNYRSAKNNFPFRDINAFGNPKPVKLQENAALEQFGLLQEHLFRIRTHQAGIKIWYQNSERQIPPTLLNNSSSDLQQDASLRSVLHWRFVSGKQVWKARTALFLESLHFQNDAVNSLSRVLSSVTEAENKWYINEQQSLNTGINYGFYKALSDGYSLSPQQHRAALFAAYKIRTKQKKLSGSIRLREEMVDGRFILPAVSLGTVWKFYKDLHFKIQLSHNYRLPTFNDLYWDILGNTDLKPEYSWNSEMGLHLPVVINKTQIKAGLTGFSNLVDNWILWSPNQQGLWRPENVEQVWARGMEVNLSVKQKWKKWQLSLGTNYAYTLSTRTRGNNSESIGKQLIYTPRHQANAHFELRYDKTTLLYQHNFTSQRYVDNLNTEVLPFFHTGHLRLSQQVKMKQLKVSLYFQVNNLFGADYQVVSRRAMPWQQFEVGLSLGG